MRSAWQLTPSESNGSAEVNVPVNVAVGVRVLVDVLVGVDVGVRVWVAVEVLAGIGVWVGVLVFVDAGVEVWVGVFVGVFVAVAGSDVGQVPWTLRNKKGKLGVLYVSSTVALPGPLKLIDSPCFREIVTGGWAAGSNSVYWPGLSISPP